MHNPASIEFADHTKTVSVASSYVFRSDASTSNGAGSTADRDHHHRDRSDSARSTFFDSSSTAASPSSPSSNASKRLSVRLTDPPHARLPSAASAAPFAGLPRGDAEDLVDEINVEENLYKILGVKRRAKTEEIRRAFLARSRIIHPECVFPKFRISFYTSEHLRTNTGTADCSF